MQEKHKILYVDDEIINLQLFKLVFSNKYEIITAENGVKGLELLDKNQDISIVISDMKMPYMTGIEFIQQSKSKYQNIRYFILTGFDITDEIQEALNHGLIIKCFRKPFNKAEINSEIESALK
jgi:two-component system, response regulator, stage 0 sporulation protein F